MNLDKTIIKQNFSRQAREYDSHARLQKRVAHELLSRAGRLDGDVLDIGSGTGILSQLSEAEMLGVDISHKMCLENEGPTINADAENLPFKNDSFDQVLSSLTIQWIDDMQKAADEIFRVLKKGGKFNISTFTGGTLLELDVSFSFLDSEAHIIKFKPAMMLFAAFKRAGFRDIVINAQTITYQHKNVREVLKSIKSVGGGYNMPKTKKGLVGKKYFEKLENVYRSKYASNGTLPATWQVLYVTGVK